MELAAIVKIVLVFVAVLFLNRVRMPLGLALISGGLTLDLWAGNGFVATVIDLGRGIVQPELWLLLLNITLIVEFGYFMAREDNGQAIVQAARNWGGRHGRAISLVLIPAAIGMVPMPGGALFSAPLVGRAVDTAPLPAAWRAAVNYWFRHILEYWWPLYPVVIVSLSIFDLPTHQFIGVQMPFTLVTVAAGYFVLLRPHLEHLTMTPADNGAEGAVPSRPLWPVVLPICLVVVATLVLPGVVRLLLPLVSNTVAKLLAMFCGLVVALILIARSQHTATPGHRLFQYLFSRKTATMLLTLMGVMIFQAMLTASGLLPTAGREMAASRIPVALIIAVLPFIAGLVTGIAIGFAGTAFPLVVGLAGAENNGMPLLAAMVLAFTMGYAGMMLSPVHLCFVLTKEYFAVSFVQMYRYLLPCVGSVVLFGASLAFLITFWGG